jgi:hypothetical protein
MARFDKSDPINSTFRVHVAVDYPDADLGKLFGFGLDANGKAVKGAGQSGVIAISVVTEKPGVVGPLRDVSRIDLMRSGCITDFGPTTGVPGVDFGVAGKKYFCTAAGVISDTATLGAIYIGQTVEPDRLEVNVVPNPIIAGQYGL